jgi:hypothetical protein
MILIKVIASDEFVDIGGLVAAIGTCESIIV